MTEIFSDTYYNRDHDINEPTLSYLLRAYVILHKSHIPEEMVGRLLFSHFRRKIVREENWMVEFVAPARACHRSMSPFWISLPASFRAHLHCLFVRAKVSAQWIFLETQFGSRCRSFYPQNTASFFRQPTLNASTKATL